MTELTYSSQLSSLIAPIAGEASDNVLLLLESWIMMKTNTGVKNKYWSRIIGPMSGGGGGVVGYEYPHSRLM